MRAVEAVGQGAPLPSGKRTSLVLRTEPSSPVVDRGPLTLTEQHAGLLQLIAQKEAKCLDLRSQLATHEAELKDLKRKWERIVSRGVDRAYAPTAPSTSSPPVNAPMLEGIKEGVQEVGRMLAAGLELSSTPNTIDLSVGSPPDLSGISALSRANLPRAMRRARHIAAQSISSISTSATSVSSAATQRLSQSSASSIEELDETKVSQPDEDLTVKPCHSPVDDVLMSPSPESRNAKLIRRRSRDTAKSPSPLSSVTAPTSVTFESTPPTRHPSALPMATLAQPVSSWVGSVGSSVGKRWEELQKVESFSKSQKRASILISDVSQSIFAALGSTTPSTPSPLSGSSRPSAKSSTPSSTKPFFATLSPLSAEPSLTSSISSNRSSLIEDDLLDSPESGTRSLGDILVPTVSKFTQPSPTKTPSTQKSLLDDDDDDDWNW